MQTFLPWPDFDDSAHVLDMKRLGKQRVETLQIMSTLLTGRGWIHHPVTKMWVGYERCLLTYQEAICSEWSRRGYNDTCLAKTTELYFEYCGPRLIQKPLWLGGYAFHISHQSNLVRKNPGYYRPRFPTVPDDIEYVWPIIT